MCGKQTDMNHNTAIHHHLYKPWKRVKRVIISIFTSTNITCTNNPWNWQIATSDNSHSIWAHMDHLLVIRKCDANTYQPFHSFLFPVSLLWSICNWQIASPAYGSWNGHLFAWLTYQWSPHPCIRHLCLPHILGITNQLAQVCHPFNIFSF